MLRLSPLVRQLPWSYPPPMWSSAWAFNLFLFSVRFCSLRGTRISAANCIRADPSPPVLACPYVYLLQFETQTFGARTSYIPQSNLECVRLGCAVQTFLTNHFSEDTRIRAQSKATAYPQNREATFSIDGAFKEAPQTPRPRALPYLDHGYTQVVVESGLKYFRLAQMSSISLRILPSFGRPPGSASRTAAFYFAGE
jgi:hypothetical protein